MRILVIEDSPTQGEILSRELANLGNEVVVRETWGYAVSELAKKPDLAVVDWNVPDVEKTRIEGVNFLLTEKIPFRIFTAYIGSVPKQFRKYAIDKARGIVGLLASIATSESVDID